MNENTQKVAGDACSIDFGQEKIRLTTAVACAG